MTQRAQVPPSAAGPSRKTRHAGMLERFNVETQRGKLCVANEQSESGRACYAAWVVPSPLDRLASPATGDVTTLRDIQVRFQALAECTSDAVFITDFDSAVFVEVNTRACELFGYSVAEFCVMTGRQLHPPEDAAVVDEISRELIKTGSVFRAAVRLRQKNGVDFWAELRSRVYTAGKRRLYVTFVRDVSAATLRETELSEAYRTLNEAELQLVRSSRLAALGELAAGVAHEVNNPAASILCNQESLKLDIDNFREELQHADPTTPLVQRANAFILNAGVCVEESLDAVQRIAGIVQNLKGYTRIDTDAVTQVDINDVARSARTLAKHELLSVPFQQFDLRATRGLAADGAKLTQVVVNLLLNAAYAVRGRRDGRVAVQTWDTNDGVMLRVTDNGGGVPGILAERIFEPFVTTKPASEGTGLGLSVCADIVAKHSGSLTLNQDLRPGATFDLYLPLDNGLSPRVPPRPSKATATPRASRVLIIDDEASLVRAYRRVLGRDHEVVGAYGGEEALRLLARDDKFDLILCDLMMPRVDGVGVYEHLERWQPHLIPRLVLCSGGPTNERCRRFLAETSVQLLLKPVRQDALLDQIQRVSQQRETPAPH